MKCKVLFSVLFIFCSIAQAQQGVDLQEFSQVKDQNVKFLFDAWKYHFGWKTLGGGYVRHVLLITDESIVEIEMPEVSNTPGYSFSGFGNLNEPSEIFLNILFFPLEKILPDPYEKMRQEIQNILDSLKQSPSVENFVSAISYLYSKRGEEIEVKNVYLRNNLKDLELKGSGDEISLSFKVDNKKQTYISRYKETEEANKVLLALQDVFEVNSEVKKEIKTAEVANDFAQMAWYIEAFGNSVIGSVNIDYRFHPNLSFRAGGSWMIFGFGFPIMLNFLTGRETSHHLEFGAGIVPVIGGFDGEKLAFFETLTLGYRYQPKKGGLVFRVSFTPLINFPDKGETRPWAGISMGYDFK